MKILYALALICLSVPAFAIEADFDGLPHNYTTETGYFYDAGADFNFADENTATITERANPKSEDYPLELGSGLEDEVTYYLDTGTSREVSVDDWF
jgi:hypothetical protein